MAYEIGSSDFNATEIAFGAYEDVMGGWTDVLYSDTIWKMFINPGSITAPNPGATEQSYRTRDWRGKGSFRGMLDNNVPTVGRAIGKNIIPIQTAGVTAKFDREDARRVAFAYETNLPTELGQNMREAGERHVEGVFFYGDPNFGFDGWMTYPNVSITVVPNGAAGTAPWVSKTPTEILFDVNNLLSTIWVNSRQVHIADCLALPPLQLAYLQSQLISDAGNKSILTFIKENNLFTTLTGGELKILPCRYLDTAGSGGADRMVAWQDKPQNYVLPFSIPFDLLEPQERGFAVDYYGEYKFGSFHAKYPGAMAYADGI